MLHIPQSYTETKKTIARQRSETQVVQNSHPDFGSFLIQYMITRKLYRLFLTVTTVFLPFALSGVNPIKSLEMMVRPNGAVVFVKSKKMPSLNGKHKAIEYDWTLSTQTDSAYIACTLTLDKPIEADSISFVWPNNLCRSVAERIYIEPKGKKWICRLRGGMKVDQFENMTTSECPPVIEIGDYQYSVSEKKWKDYGKIYKTAVEIVRINK